MRTKYLFSFATSILAKLSTWCFEHSCDISCSLLVNASHTDEPWEVRNTCLYSLNVYVHTYIYIYVYTIYTHIYI